MRAANPDWTNDNLLLSAELRRNKRMVEEIRAEAAGRTCGDCIAYVRSGYCSEQLNVEGAALRIIRPVAPACREWAQQGGEYAQGS